MLFGEDIDDKGLPDTYNTSVIGAIALLLEQRLGEVSDASLGASLRGDGCGR